MGGLRRHNSPTGLSAKNSRVGFADSLVTGISRPVNNEEHWILYYFEAHAAQCLYCETPLQVSTSGRQLCDEGHQLAIDVAELIFRQKDGKVYSHVKDGEQEVASRYLMVTNKHFPCSRPSSVLQGIKRDSSQNLTTNTTQLDRGRLSSQRRNATLATSHGARKRTSHPQNHDLTQLL